jgi:hypothetical protein
MHRRAGVKLHHRGVPIAPPEGFLLRDKQDEKRIASSANVPETSSVASPSVLPLPHSILRPAPAPLLNPKSMLTDVGPVELWATRWRRPSAAANPQGFCWPATPRLTHFITTRHADPPYPLAPPRKIGRNKSDEAVGVSFGQHSSYPGCLLPGFYFGIKPGVSCRSAQLLVVWRWRRLLCLSR